MDVQFEIAKLLVRLERHFRSVHVCNHVYKPRVPQPFKGDFVFSRTRTRSQRRIDELLVFLGKLRRHRIPKKTNFGKQTRLRVLCEIFVVVSKDSLLDAPYLCKVSRFRIRLDRLRHSTDKIVPSHKFRQLLVEAFKCSPSFCRDILCLYLFANGP